MPKLKQTLEQDALNFINKTYRQVVGINASDFRNLKPEELKRELQFYERLSRIEKRDLTKVVADKLAKRAPINSAVSDLIGGLTQNRLAGQELVIYGHEPTYWQYSKTLEMEAIAHLFEALGSGGVRLEAMQEVFPTSLDSFIKYLRWY